MIRNYYYSYYYRVSYHDDSQSAGSLLRQPMRAKVSCDEQSQSRVAKHSDGKHQVVMTKLTKQPRKSTNELTGLEQCHEQSRHVNGGTGEVGDAVRKASR